MYYYYLCTYKECMERDRDRDRQTETDTETETETDRQRQIQRQRGVCVGWGVEWGEICC